ncbi:hypothetical protein VNO78_26118 [Psophocarpus tetragonolobus]|uniref:Uncharacterized protein n=1 Tax=Psophocarpus tetragonolobus TaxID=3891 RepID=A0AAN9X9D8_PSOTE
MAPDLEPKSDPQHMNARKKILVPVKVHMDHDVFGTERVPIKKLSSACGDEDVDVDIVGCSNLGKAFVVEDSWKNAPECSSSFGDTVSCVYNVSSFSDTEVESRLDEPFSSTCDDWSESCKARKKRMTKCLTGHWRRFIRPISWRCKWIELQMKQLQSQTRKYEKELAMYDYNTKQLYFANLTLDGSNIKSVPISGRMLVNKVMKRNKRKRVEEKCDITSYMSNHSLFSYHEKTGCTADTCSKDFHDIGIGGDNDSNKEFKPNEEFSYGEYENIDESLDYIIQQIEAIQAQVQQLKTRTNTVISENCGKFCSITQLSMPGPSDRFNDFGMRSPTFTGNGSTFPSSFPHSSSQFQSKFHMEDFLMAGNASASRERIIPYIETTNRHRLDDSQEDCAKYEVLIQNQAFEEEWHDFNYDENDFLERTKESIEEDKFIYEVKDEVLVQKQLCEEEWHGFKHDENCFIERSNESIEEDNFISQIQASEHNSPENVVHNEHFTWNSFYPLMSNVPRNKRKRRTKSIAQGGGGGA